MNAGSGENSWVAYVGPFRYPWGQAASRRVHGNALALARAGRRVVVVSGEAPSGDHPHLGEEDAKNVQHVRLGETLPRSVPRPLRVVRNLLTWGALTVDWLDAQETKPTHVILYGGGTPYAARLVRWCKSNGVSLIIDVVEWYDPRQFAGGRLSPSYLSSTFAFRWLYRRADGIIAISSLIDQHFSRLGLPTAVVPPTLDASSFDLNGTAPAGHSPLRLLYFGTPGKKDALPGIVEGLSRLGGAVLLTIAGPSRTTVERLVGRRDLPQNVKIVGHVDQSEVGELLAACDFTVLARENARFARAGFPTKLVESLASGVPVIVTPVGDLPLYVQDGREVIAATGPSASEVESAAIRALKLNPQQRADMREQARKTARRSFDYRVYTDTLVSLLTRVERP